MPMAGKEPRRWRRALLATIGLLGVVLTLYFGWRVFRFWTIFADWQTRIRYLVETGVTIGQRPAEEVVTVDYLQTIFGENPQLLEQLKQIVQIGLEKQEALSAAMISALLVTYHLDEDNTPKDVIVHVIGSFPIARRKPGFHRDGFFFQQLDPELWQAGNLAISFLGRDVLMFGPDEEAAGRHRAVIDTLFSGQIGELVSYIDPPLYYSVVLPNPKEGLPIQLRPHVQSVVIKGSLGHMKGRVESLVLCPSPKSARYTSSVLSDFKLAAEIALRTKFDAVPRRDQWGNITYTWWAHEMLKTSEAAVLEQSANIVRLLAEFDRIMVNAVLKSVERLFRDLAAMRQIEDEREDPRLADARLRSRHPLHYWSDEHQWGPDWPIPAPRTNEVSEAQAPPPSEPSAP